jgi:PST family polysaccharide transporter
LAREGIKFIAVNTGYLSLARIIANITRAVYYIVLAKLLGSELYGQFNYNISWYAIFIPISTLGIGTVLIREIGKHRNTGIHLAKHSYTLQLFASSFTALMCLLLGLVITPESTSSTLLFIFSLALFGRSLTLWTGAMFKAYGISKLELRQVTLFRLLEVLLGSLLLLLGFGIVEVAVVHAASWLLQGFSGLRLVRNHLYSLSFTWNRTASWSLVKKGMPFVIGGFLLSWILQGPILMYRNMVEDSSNLGQLALALQALFIIGAIISEFGSAALPVLARSIHRGDGKSDSYISLVLRGGFLISGVAAMSAVAIGPWLIYTAFDETFSATIELLPWTMALIAPFFWSNTLLSMIAAHGNYGKVIISNALGSLTFTLSFPVLLSQFELLGTIIALAIGLSSVVITQLYILHAKHDIPLIATIVKPALAVSAAVLFTALTSPLQPVLGLIGGFTLLVIISIVIKLFSVEEYDVFLGLLKSRKI